MNTTMSTVSSGGDKRLSETIVQTVAQNLTTMQQNVQNVQNVQSVVQSNIQSIQPTQTIVGSVGTPGNLVGKSVSLDMNPKLSVMKPVVPSGTTSSAETSKITTALCSLGSAVKIIPGMLSTVERQNPSQTQITHPVSMPATYHVPRGPAAVANISVPRSTPVATPIVRTNTGQIVPTTRPGNTPMSNTQWQPKTTSVALYASQRHPAPSVSRVSRPSSTVYTGQQPRLITPTNQGRSVQATMVTGSPSRLITPVLQTNLTRHPVAQNRPPTPQVVTVSQTSQPTRSSAQAIQPTQSNRPLTTTGTTKRITVSTPIVETTNRITSTGSVTIGSVEPTVARQLSISGNTVPGPSTVSHIVIPSQQVQSQSAPRVVQTVTSLSSLSTVSQVITTTTNTQSNAMRILQTVPTTVAKLAGMSLHPLPITLPVRATSAPIKAAPAQSQNIGQTIQVKPAPQANLRVSSTNSSTATSSAQPVQGQYIHPPHTTTTAYLSFEPTGSYSQFRQTSVQPVRLVVEPGYEESHGKPNASPRPSILRKRDHDNSPIKGESQLVAGAAKNLVPVLTSLASSRSMSSPPCSPKGDQDGGCQSSGSTTVSATSSPGLDEEPEESRITINPTLEMSPRKKPRKQQLTGVELTEPRCTEEEMQFITEEKIKKEIKEESKEKMSDKRQFSNVQSDIKSSTQQTEITIRTRPVPSLLGSSWKNKWTVRLHHFRRPSDVRPREERRPTVAELAQQKHVLQKLNGWKIYHLTTQMEDIAALEKQVHEKLKTTLMLLESQQTVKTKHSDGLERVNELIKGNMQRSSLISEGMNEARTQLVAIFQHKAPITDLLQRCGNKRAQKKKDK